MGYNLKPFGSDWDVIDAACRLLGLYAFRSELVYIGVCLDPLERLTVGEYEPGDWRLEREFLQGSAYTLRFVDTEAEAVAALRDVLVGMCIWHERMGAQSDARGDDK